MAIVVTALSGLAGATVFQSGYGGNQTFSNVNGGVSFASGAKVVIYLSRSRGDEGANAWSGLTVGGNNMSRAAGDITNGSATSSLECWYYDCVGSTTDSIVVPGNSSSDFFGIVGQYLTGAATGAPASTSEQQFGQQDDSTPNNLAITASSGGVALFGFYANNVALIGATGNTPIWANCAQSASDVSAYLASKADLACNHATGTGSSIDAQVSPTTGTYAFLAGMIAVTWNASAGADVLAAQIWL